MRKWVLPVLRGTGIDETSARGKLTIPNIGTVVVRGEKLVYID